MAGQPCCWHCVWGSGWSVTAALACLAFGADELWWTLQLGMKRIAMQPSHQMIFHVDDQRCACLHSLTICSARATVGDKARTTPKQLGGGPAFNARWQGTLLGANGGSSLSCTIVWGKRDAIGQGSGLGAAVGISPRRARRGPARWEPVPFRLQSQRGNQSGRVPAKEPGSSFVRRSLILKLGSIAGQSGQL